MQCSRRRPGRVISSGLSAYPNNPFGVCNISHKWAIRIGCKKYFQNVCCRSINFGNNLTKKSFHYIVYTVITLMNQHLKTIVVCPLTSRLHPTWRSRLQIMCAAKHAEIAIDQIRTISKHRLQKKIDSLTKSEAAQLRRLITEMYGE